MNTHLSQWMEIFMNYRNIKTFCVTADLLSFKKAAEELFLSASAVSHQVKDLEDYLNVKLFERHTRSIKLTAEGHRFNQSVRLNLDAIDEATENLKAEVKRNRVFVQMPEFFASELFIPLLPEFAEHNRDIDLRIESVDSPDQLDERADVNIFLTRKPPLDENVQRLFPIKYVPACSRSLNLSLPLNGQVDLSLCTILLHKARPHSWRQWAEVAGIEEVQPAQIILVDSMFALARAAEQGVGVALIPMPVSQSWFNSGALIRVSDIELVSSDYYCIATSADVPEGDSTELLSAWIVQKFSELHTEPMHQLYSTVA
jgi:LysR family glycine cleavage system transcriptional activator